MVATRTGPVVGPSPARAAVLKRRSRSHSTSLRVGPGHIGWAWYSRLLISVAELKVLVGNAKGMPDNTEGRHLELSIGRCSWGLQSLDSIQSGQGARMVWAKHPFHVEQQLLEQPQCLCRMPAVSGPEGDVAASGQGAGILWPKHPFHVGQQLLEQPQRLRRMPALPGQVRDVVAGSQCLLMIWAKHPLAIVPSSCWNSSSASAGCPLCPVQTATSPRWPGSRDALAQAPVPIGQQLLEQLQCLRRMPAVPGPEGDVAASGQGAEMLWPKHPFHVGQQLLEQLQRLRRMPALPGPEARRRREWPGCGDALAQAPVPCRAAAAGTAAVPSPDARSARSRGRRRREWPGCGDALAQAPVPCRAAAAGTAAAPPPDARFGR